MGFVDTHTHTKYSFDGEMTMEEAVIKARKCGLFGISFTDHFDLFENESIYDFEKHQMEAEMLKSKYETDNFKIFNGVELGLKKDVFEKSKDIINPYKFDLIIASTHRIDGMDPYYGEFFKKDGKIADKIDRYGRYIDVLIENLYMYKGYDIFGHIDYIVRYAPYDDKIFYHEDFGDKIDFIFKFIIENDMAFEVNTSTYSRVPMDVKLLKRYRELGGEKVSLGSDAHYVEKIGIVFDEYAKIISDCGFKYITYYENRKPRYIKI